MGGLKNVSGDTGGFSVTRLLLCTQVTPMQKMLTETVTYVYNWCVRLWLPQAAAQGSEACLSLDGSDGGGFTLTLPIRGINLFSLYRHICHILHRVARSAADCERKVRVVFVQPDTVVRGEVAEQRGWLNEEQTSVWGHCADVLSHRWGPTAVKTGRWVGYLVAKV